MLAMEMETTGDRLESYLGGILGRNLQPLIEGREGEVKLRSMLRFPGAPWYHVLDNICFLLTPLIKNSWTHSRILETLSRRDP